MSARARPLTRKWLVAGHVLSSVLWLGTACAQLAIATYLAWNDLPDGVPGGAYRIMTYLDETLLRVGAVGALVTGLTLGVVTPYRLTRYWWVVYKELVTVAVITFGTLGVHGLHQAAARVASSGVATEGGSGPAPLRLAISAQVLALVSALVVSSLKPWGRVRTARVSNR